MMMMMLVVGGGTRSLTRLLNMNQFLFHIYHVLNEKEELETPLI